MELAALFFTLVITTLVLALSIKKLMVLHATLHAIHVLVEVYARGRKV